MFEDKDLADQAVVAVEKQIHHEDMENVDSNKVPIPTSTHVEEGHKTG